MKKHLENLINEKGIDINSTFEMEGKTGANFITLEVVIEHILISTKQDQKSNKRDVD
jgi:hypothetical protein